MVFKVGGLPLSNLIHVYHIIWNPFLRGSAPEPRKLLHAEKFDKLRLSKLGFTPVTLKTSFRSHTFQRLVARPTFSGLQEAQVLPHSRLFGSIRYRIKDKPEERPVYSIAGRKEWIPAFAGMTDKGKAQRLRLDAAFY